LATNGPVVEQRLAPGFDRVDMRLFAERLGRELPHGGESRVEQLRAAVAAEHGDRFAQIVERFALDADQAVVASRQIEALGDVVEQVGDAAFGIRRGDDAQRAAIGQVPGVLFGLNRTIGFVQLGLPGAEVRLLGQLARGAQPVEHAGIVWIAVEEGAVEVPQPAIAVVVERKPPPAVENRDTRRKLVERAAMGFRHPHQGFAQRVGLRGVDRHADAAAADIERLHVEEPSLAADHDRQPCCKRRGFLQGAAHVGAIAAIEQLHVAGDRVAGVGRFRGLGVGVVDILQAAVGALRPDRPRRRLREAAQHLGFLQQRAVMLLSLGQFPAHAG
jgi:hypothetical protein